MSYYHTKFALLFAGQNYIPGISNTITWGDGTEITWDDVTEVNWSAS